MSGVPSPCASPCVPTPRDKLSATVGTTTTLAPGSLGVLPLSTASSVATTSLPTATCLGGTMTPFPPQRPVARVMRPAVPIAQPAMPMARPVAVLRQATPVYGVVPGPAVPVRTGTMSAPVPPPSMGSYSMLPGSCPETVTVQRPKVNYVEKVVDVPQVQKVRVAVKGPVEVKEVVKYVPKVVHVPEVKYREVPQVQVVQQVVEVPEIVTKQVIKHRTKVEHREVIRQVARDVVQYRDREVEVPQPVPTVVVERRVPRIQVQQEQYQVPQVQIVEKIVEVPQVQYVPQTVNVPKTETRVQVQHVRKPQIQIVEKIVDVPQVVHHEKIVEVPRVQYVDRIRHVPKIEMEHVQLPRSHASFGAIPPSPQASVRAPSPMRGAMSPMVVSRPPMAFAAAGRPPLAP
eukprot:TRINITY_DN6665_c0_g1_i1.p2 TRINITY_DN6665_c0_g1~~TRINITY_DN6665_c0_g1_i1.p2  ORF type:complete len:432 (-),score=83.99 TRINITY_DN6665_c0_g1_i1:145-1350(-)